MRQIIIRVEPGLTVEPLASLYRRRAACYRFIRGVLDEAFGPEAHPRMHRLTPDGLHGVDLAEELGTMEALFTGAYLTACRELGMEANADNASRAEDSFRRWAGDLGRDKDLGRDARMMVPVFYDIERRMTKVWAFLGWQSTRLGVRYSTPPRVIGCERLGEPKRSVSPSGSPTILFSEGGHQLATPVVAEVFVKQLLDRDEFRRLCDRHRTRSAILSNLR